MQLCITLFIMCCFVCRHHSWVSECARNENLTSLDCCKDTGSVANLGGSRYLHSLGAPPIFDPQLGIWPPITRRNSHNFLGGLPMFCTVFHETFGLIVHLKSAFDQHALDLLGCICNPVCCKGNKHLWDRCLYPQHSTMAAGENTAPNWLDLNSLCVHFVGALLEYGEPYCHLGCLHLRA